MIARKYIVLIVVLTLPIAIWITGRITGGLSFYSLATPSNYPTISPNSYFFTTNLRKPHRKDFVVFNVPNEAVPWVFRLVAIAGDTVQIIQGELYVNRELVDASFQLAKQYLISKQDCEKIRIATNEETWKLTPFDAEKMLWTASEQEFKTHNFTEAKEFIYPGDFVDEAIRSKWKQDWNPDYFGPLVIPVNQNFVLGDNRHNALDSRYIGFISDDNIQCIVLNKR